MHFVQMYNKAYYLRIQADLSSLRVYPASHALHVEVVLEAVMSVQLLQLENFRVAQAET